MQGINLLTTVNTEAPSLSTEYYKLSYQVLGIKKRCRKSDRHFFHLGKIDLNYNRDEIISQVRKHAAENMESIDSILRVSLDHITSNNEPGFLVEQWRPFSDKNIQFDITKE